MIDTLSVLLLNGYTYVRKHPQLLMTMMLVVVIPVAFLISGQQFLNASKGNQERLEKDRIGIFHDVFASFVVSTSFNSDTIQREIEHIASQNLDITRLGIAKETGGEVTIIASINQEEINNIVSNPTTYRIGNTHPGESIIMPYTQNGIRYWQSYRLIQTEGGDDYYIFSETSLAYIDDLFASRIMSAYYWLFGILAIVLLLVIRHVRLIDYAYLYSETKKANEMKDLFTNMIAHELRAPLTAMRGYASMIREKDTNVETSGYAQRIEDSAERLVLIVSDLLDVARIHSGKLSIKNERTDIQKVITSVLETLESSAQEKQITLKQESILPELVVNIDSKRFHQALTNLVSNSIKYTKAGNIGISIEERRDRVELRVKDTGMGISAENQKNLFAPFFRIENTETEGTVGTGLGMWITKQLIELMKGSIAVESIRGVGTHIVVTLPK